MDDYSARPRALKKVNLSSIRRIIKKNGSATRAEIAWETKISSTTIRSLLNEMLANGEIESIGLDPSSGGRKAERYCFRPERYFAVAFCITDAAVHYLIVNICGEIVSAGELAISDCNIKTPLIEFLDNLIKQKEIRAIGFGLPGVIDDGGYLRNLNTPQERVDISSFFTQRYHVPVVLENDLNAIAIGFGRCYSKNFMGENPAADNIAILYFEKDCVSAGFISGGKVIHGHNNYAGELGLIPIHGEKTLDDQMAEPMDNLQYTAAVSKIISWICGILNPQYIAIGGPGYRAENHGLISNALYALLPDKMLPEILYFPDVMHDYYEGMAFLTAAKIFDEVQLVKER